VQIEKSVQKKKKGKKVDQQGPKWGEKKVKKKKSLVGGRPSELKKQKKWGKKK